MTLKGLALPVRATRAGRSAVSTRDEHAAKVLMIALADCDNENAFQQNRGLGSGMVFGNSSEELRAQVLRRLTEIFREFESQLLYRLVDESISWSEDAANGDLTISFRYINLESDEERDFSQAFTVGS